MAAAIIAAPPAAIDFNVLDLEEFQLQLDIGQISTDPRNASQPQRGKQFTAHVSATIPIPSDPTVRTHLSNPIVIFNNGFQIDSSQYTTYSHHLASQGYLTLRYYIDWDYPWPAIDHQDLADCILRLMQVVGESAQLKPYWPSGPGRFVLMGHSRGGKLAIFATCRLAELRIQGICVEALILLDPVDAKDPKAADRMPQLREEFPPTLILGSELGKRKRSFMFFASACAPEDCNYEVLYRRAQDVVGVDAVQRVVQCMALKDTGHLQYLDRRGDFTWAFFCVCG
eukprot:CAMPEP_0184708488 /NCGR_PEP_ID=MMETSP0313-20130426/37803_1 /TAXON_ID=2792 /ORGANISM="Porphyridium aerugineum, Strain SAG 1380-2" /LENGTH=283 /DNA_ID=CAMNT_0027170081 /DNA_START=311 /DNA_END=1158 /DNA_ORIENTATION=+